MSTSPIDQFLVAAIPQIAAEWASGISEPALDRWWIEGDRARVWSIVRATGAPEPRMKYALLEPDLAVVDAVAALAIDDIFSDREELVALAARVPARSPAVVAKLHTDEKRRSAAAAILYDHFDPDKLSGLTALELALGCARRPDRDARLAGLFARDDVGTRRFAIVAALHAAGALHLVPDDHALFAAHIVALAGDGDAAARLAARGTDDFLAAYATVAPTELGVAQRASVYARAATAAEGFDDGLLTTNELAAIRWAAACIDRDPAAIAELRRAEIEAAHKCGATFIGAILAPEPDVDVPVSRRRRDAADNAIARLRDDPTDASALRGVARELESLGDRRHYEHARNVAAAVEQIAGPLAALPGYRTAHALAVVPGRAAEAAALLDEYSARSLLIAIACALLRDGDAAAATAMASRALAEQHAGFSRAELVRLARAVVRTPEERARVAALAWPALARLPTDAAWPVGDARLDAPAAHAVAAARSPDLEAQLAALEPDDPATAAAISVYADFLAQHGDPRGEMLALERAGRVAEALLLRDHHAAHFYGELADYATALDGTSEPVFAWRDGFLARARLGIDARTSAPGARTLARAVEVLGAHPSGALLRELVLAFAVTDDGWNLAPAIAALAQADRPALRTLVLGEYEFNGNSARPDTSRGANYEISWAKMPDLRALWPRLPNLRHLTICGALEDDVLGDLSALAKLETLEIRSGGVARENLVALAAAHLPALATLELWCGSSDYGFTGGVADLAPILAGDRLPALRTLRLMNCELADELVVPIARSGLLPRLAMLGLAMGTLTDEGARLLREHRAAFAHLDLLELDDNCLADPGAVQSLVREVWCDSQKDPETERYVSVGE